MAERSKMLGSGSREPGSIRVSDLLVVFFFCALPTRKGALTGNEHSRSCVCPYTRKKAVRLGDVPAGKAPKKVLSCLFPTRVERVGIYRY